LDADYALVGAGLGEDINHTQDLHVLTFQQAMKLPERDKWLIAIEQEHQRMLNHQVWELVTYSDVDITGKILSTTWAMKRKADGKFCACLTARGYEQIEGIHYDRSSTAAPVTNDTTIRIMLSLAAMSDWSLYIVNVQGAFLNGRFGSEEKLYLQIPKGFEDKYNNDQVLFLKRTIYGLKQAAQAFWVEPLQAFNAMGFKGSNADPCCYIKEIDKQLTICLSWVDDCLIMGTRDNVINTKTKLMEYFECDNVRFSNEYVGCKIELNNGKVKFTQPVLLRSLVDEFNARDKGYQTPAASGQTLQPGNKEDEVTTSKMRKYQTGVGKLLYLSQWSRPDIINMVRELLRFTARAHMESMNRVMDYFVGTMKKGLILTPKGKWDGKKDGTKIQIVGKSNSNYAKDLETRRSVSGYCVFMNGAPVGMKSKMQATVTLGGKN
jgi:Reverse transcriptase (RNA-dependent DNA polymerase)